MTATESPILDLGRLAIVAEGFAPPDGALTVEVTTIESLNPDSDSGGWAAPSGDGSIVIVPIGTPSNDLADAFMAHLGSELGLAVQPCEGTSLPAPLDASAVGVHADDGSGFALYIAPDLPAPQVTQSPAGFDDGLISLGLLRGVPLEVSAELGRARLAVAEILQLNVGSVIELDRTAGSPADVVVNGSLIARGEVVIIDDEYGIRITEIFGRSGD